MNVEQAIQAIIEGNSDPETQKAGIRSLVTNAVRDAVDKAVRQDREFLAQVMRGLPMPNPAQKQQFINSPTCLKSALTVLLSPVETPQEFFTFEEYPVSANANLILATAKDKARLWHSRWVETEHLLLSIIKSKACVANAILGRLGLNPANIGIRICEEISPKSISKYQPDKVDLSPAMKGILTQADQIRKRFKREEIHSEHILLAIINSPGGLAYTILTRDYKLFFDLVWVRTLEICLRLDLDGI